MINLVPLEFAVEFVKRARITGIPTSTRQVITIAKLGHTRRLRKGPLQEEDWVELASLTTAPPHQALAADLARQIIQGVPLQDDEENFEHNVKRFLEQVKETEADGFSREEKLDPFEKEPPSLLTREFNKMSREEFEQEIRDRLEKEGFHKTLSFLNWVDRSFDTDFASELLEIAREELEALDIEDLLENVVDNDAWVDLVSEMLESPLEQPKDILRRLMEAKEQLPDQALQDDMADGPISRMIDTLLRQSETFEEFMELKQAAEEAGASFPEELAKELGEELGFTPMQMAELESEPEEFLRAMIKTGQSNFESVSRILMSGKISTWTTEQLIGTTIENSDEQALAAFLTHRFSETLKRLDELNADEEIISWGLGSANGENILENWFAEKDMVPDAFKEVLRDYAHDVLIELGRKWATAFGEGMESGVLAGGTLRPWSEGDEFEQVDIEESLENILQSGKALEDILPSDILVRDYEQGRRAILLLIDSSGSMAGLPLKTAVATGVMLTFALRNEDLAIAVFGSRTTVYCSVEDRRRQPDEIVDGLLSLEAKGGTVLGAGVDWALEELKITKATEKIVFVVTDSLIYDLRESLKKVQEMVKKETLVVFVVPSGADDYQDQRWQIEETGAVFISLNDWKDFPSLVRDILARR